MKHYSNSELSRRRLTPKAKPQGSPLADKEVAQDSDSATAFETKVEEHGGEEANLAIQDDEGGDEVEDNEFAEDKASHPSAPDALSPEANVDQEADGAEELSPPPSSKEHEDD